MIDYVEHELAQRLGPPDDGTSIEKVGVRRDGRILTAQAQFLYWKCGCCACAPLPNAHGVQSSATLCDRHRSVLGRPSRRSIRGEIRLHPR